MIAVQTANMAELHGMLCRNGDTRVARPTGSCALLPDSSVTKLHDVSTDFDSCLYGCSCCGVALMTEHLA